MNGVAGYIYRITNNINKKWYIGSSRGATTLNLAKRHTEYMGSGIYLNNAYKKYGIENFTKDILCIAEEAYDLEGLILKTLDAANDPMSYNCTNEAGNGFELGPNNYVYTIACKEYMNTKYGADQYMASEDFKSKAEYTMMSTYGVKHSMQSEELKEKAKRTVKEKYGVDNISQLDSIKQKKIDTCMANYGVEYPGYIIAKCLRAFIVDNGVKIIIGEWKTKRQGCADTTIDRGLVNRSVKNKTGGGVYCNKDKKFLHIYAGNKPIPNEKYPTYYRVYWEEFDKQI